MEQRRFQPGQVQTQNGFFRALILVIAGLVTGATASWAATNSPTLLAKPKPAERNANLSYEEMNATFGIPLWASDRLWDEDYEAVRQRLRLSVESSGKNEYDRKSALGKPKEAVLGETVENFRITGDAKQVTSVMIMFANKGDSVVMEPNQREYKNRSAEYREARQAHEKSASELRSRIREASRTVEDRLRTAFGDPKLSSVSHGGTVRDSVKVWSWKDHAISLAKSPGDGVVLRIQPVQEALAKGKTQRISDSDLKKELLSHVERRPNGDVVVTGIPMVSQGNKGYCVPATCARYLQFVGIPIDEYILAEAARTAPGGGTGREIFTAMEGVLRKNHRRLITLSGPLSYSRIGDYIDKGMPMIWAMSALPSFNKLGLPPDRMGTSSLDEWLAKLKPNRDAGRKLAKYKYQGLNAHWCMIIGYNKLTKEVATSDSWGPAAQERWFPFDAAKNVSGDHYYVIHY